jgi:predicted DNA-binding ribbon-helix-helix protein
VTDIRLMENISWRSDINLFSNYESFGNMVVNFNSTIRMKVNRFISTRIETMIIYDEEVFIRQDDGSSRQAVQLQNLINFGISLDF